MYEREGPRCGTCVSFRPAAEGLVGIGSCGEQASDFFLLEVRAEYLGCSKHVQKVAQCRGLGKV